MLVRTLIWSRIGIVRIQYLRMHQCYAAEIKVEFFRKEDFFFFFFEEMLEIKISEIQDTEWKFQSTKIFKIKFIISYLKK